jgi:hypothetical protein
MQRPLRVLTESEAQPQTFHDCHVHGIHWRRERFTFSMHLQYILEWLPPSDGSSAYRFSIAEAQVTFQDVDDLKVSMDWSGAALDSQIASLRAQEARTTPNGRIQRYFSIEFADPEAIISLWSTGYEVRLLQEPVTSEVSSIPPSDET